MRTSPDTRESPSVTSAKTPGSTAFHMSAPVLFWLNAPIATYIASDLEVLSVRANLLLASATWLSAARW